MNISNFEFKASVPDITPYEQQLLTLHPIFQGIDHQIDTYFNVPVGRLKLREGNIENALIHYQRSDVADLKLSDIILYKHTPNEALKQILTKQLGVKVVVDKVRKIYFIDNIKFHFDKIDTLGQFIEVEAIATDDSYTIEQLKEQCNKYFDFFKLEKTSLIDKSYSDLLLQKA